MTLSHVIVDPAGESDESGVHDDAVATDGTVDTPTGEGTEPLSSLHIPHFGVLHFDESVAGLSLADVSVVLVGDYPVAVPIPRSLAKTCGFVVLDVDDDVLRSIGVVDDDVVPEEIPTLPILPTEERTRKQRLHALYPGVVGETSAPPRSASEVQGDINSADLSATPQHPVELAPVALAFHRGYPASADEPSEPAEQLFDKLAQRSPELAPASQPLSVHPGFERAETASAVPDLVEGPQFYDELSDVARPFATYGAVRADVGYVEAQTWPEVERRLEERTDEPGVSGPEPVLPPEPIAETASFLAVHVNVEADSTPAASDADHVGFLSPLAADPESFEPLDDDQGGFLSPLAESFEPLDDVPVDDFMMANEPVALRSIEPESLWGALGETAVPGIPVTVDAAMSVQVDPTRPMPDDLRQSLGLDDLRQSDTTENDFAAERTEHDIAEPTENDIAAEPSQKADDANRAVWAHGARRVFGESGLEVVLDDFSVDEGQLVVVFDGSGFGRTSLCRLLAGFEPLDAGRLRVGGRFLETLTIEERAIREAGSIAFADANPILVGDLTVAENLELPLLISRRDPYESRSLVMDTLTDFELDFLADRVVDDLPRPERVRLGVLRAVLSGDVVVLDDPLAEGDTVLRNEVVEWLRVATSAGMTVFYATSEFDMSAQLRGVPGAIFFEMVYDDDRCSLRSIDL